MSGCGSANCNCGSNCSCGSGCKCGRSFDESTLLMREAAGDMSLSSIVSASSGISGESVMSREENGCKCGPNCSCNDCSCHK
ncbi:metallothionein-like protein type 2 [Selaginella moellendorffii]|uniref:metallothionein-like protein type 2 n=1 Tax=Selaginella moellendorffii TaxID=88036 RepID=UPI000D1C7D4D|nr:metallothionein-like protein type 2 [Selaginella moellendorffii]|eukprot:XP_024535473.1 metallothionein-like protein type 2 [Selaginella moellendorffii]